MILPSMQPAHLKPEPAFKHDIESPEDRMAFTIERYRAAGKWADANRVEQKLADLQKRPADLVPAPDVAQFGLHSEPMRDSQKANGIPPDNNWHPSMPENPPVQRTQPRPAPRSAPNGSAAPGPRKPAKIEDLPGWLDEDIPESAYGGDA